MRPPARTIPRRKHMSVLKNPYKGVRGLRYSFMEQNAPEELARMDAAGETEEYLKAVERNYLTRLAELQDSCMESCGATPEFAQLTMAQCRYDDYIRKADSASKMAEEIALNETVLTL